MLRLSAIFRTAAMVVRDAEVLFTLGPNALRPGALCYALNAALIEKANRNPHIAAVITTPELAEAVAGEKGCLISSLPRLDFYRFHNELCRSGGNRLHHGETTVDPTASLGPGVILGRSVVVGPGVRIGAHAVVDDYTLLGANTVIGAHVVIGGRALHNTWVDGENVLLEIAGGVKIGARCEILSGALIQRSYLSEYTEIGDDAKLGPGSSVGHGCTVGRASSIGTRSVVAGNAKIGEEVLIGPGSVISDAVQIGDRAQVKLGSVVIANVPGDEAVSGNFALSHTQHLRLYTRQRHER
jgi:UDP-3-O-[3-hydroxymyristoyl] glucosamine N-acyltransferase